MRSAFVPVLLVSLATASVVRAEEEAPPAEGAPATETAPAEPAAEAAPAA